MERLLTWEDQEVVVHSVEELDERLDELAAEAASRLPFMVSVVREDGSSLSIGVGRPESVASYMPGSYDPPYYLSRGDGGRDTPVEFVFGGEMSEFPPWSAIPADAARDAARVFFETGELSPKISWEES